MDWLTELIAGHSTAHTVFILSLVIAGGVALGHARIFNISLGIGGVLFVGLLFGHLQLTISDEIIEFAREFGLILFVYTIGMQVGPSFFASFRKQGLKLNLLAASVVLVGVAVTVLIHVIFKVPVPALVGVLTGAVTNTPGLGAAQEALKQHLEVFPDANQISGLGYAMAYPFGILGIIFTMILTRRIFNITPAQEAEEFRQAQMPSAAMPDNFNIEVKNPRLAGQDIPTLASIVKADFVVSRLLRGEHVVVPTAETRMQIGDVLHVVCSRDIAEKLAIVVGDVSPVDVRAIPSQLTARTVLITQDAAVGRTIGDLDLMRRYGVAITRLHRAGIELVATTHMELHFGDRVTVVGDEAALGKVAAELGDSVSRLMIPNILPVFIGIIIGVVVGSIPFSVPGVPAPVKLGLAGGPLLVAILLSRFGRIGPVVWYIPHSGNLMLREVGITLFLACVGLKSGGRFVETLLYGGGVYWMLMGVVITVVPLLVVAAVARMVYKLNYLSLCGLLAGSMTDPPALSFANQITASDAPSITYASVYALVMFLRILSAQALVIFLM